jgi:hypothetical protein
MKILSCLAVFSLLSSGPQQPSAPQEGVVVRELGVGFHATCELPNLPLRAGEPRKPPYVGKIETWMPFQITLENLGPSVEGTLVLSDAFVTGAPDVAFRKRVTLPAHSRKHVSFPVFHRGGQAPRVLSFEDGRGGSILLDGARNLDVSPPHTAGATSSLIMIATESRGNFSHFLSKSRDGTFSVNRYVLPVLPVELPSYALEYHGVDALALDDIPLDTLTSDQQDAIRQFVARGGTLIVSVFRNAERMRQAKLAELLPGAPEGVQNVTDVGALRAATGYRCILDAPMAMTTFQWEPKTCGWGESPKVLAHRPFESGVVVACGFPISARFLETWPGAPRFLEMLTEARPADPTPIAGGIQSAALRADIALALKESMVRSIPPFRMVLWIMLGYGATIAILPYALFRRLNRIEWSWVAVFVFALGGAGVVYGVGQSYLRKDSIAYRVGLIDGGGEEGAHLRHNFWSLFTARGDRLDLSFEEASAVPYPLGRELKLRGTADDQMLTIGYDDVRLAAFRTYSQDSSLFETTDRIVLSSRLVLAAREESGAAAVRLRTGGTFPIRRGWIVGAGDVSEVSDFPGEETVVSVSNSTMADVAARLRDAHDPLLEKVVGILLPLAQARSKLTRRRVLLYLYDGAPSLKNQAIPERGLDFGILDVGGADLVPDEEHWQFRRLAGSGQDSSYETALYSPEGVIYSMVLKDLPHGCRAKDIRFGDSPFFTLELFDQRDQAWKTVAGHSPQGVEGLVHHSPLGCAYALLRTRAAHRTDNRNEYQYWGVPAINNLDAVSRIERKAP